MIVVGTQENASPGAWLDLLQEVRPPSLFHSVFRWFCHGLHRRFLLFPCPKTSRLNEPFDSRSDLHSKCVL